ncbi:hypothetical protein HMPREF0183_1976 [Brevibacterium mcbrellneri ATCC 49030]|uniref:Uncharacterized protein n=1 Tax=Brevibacterium mcbrellneri ATCC 49030 TaxID=585530 RepID=D4YPW6_9MICO|nr:hypothetical protein HMPREF0183_1976 [Brevibacterium mcbrellneri ATCC 49030]
MTPDALLFSSLAPGLERPRRYARAGGSGSVTLPARGRCLGRG